MNIMFSRSDLWSMPWILALAIVQSPIQQKKVFQSWHTKLDPNQCLQTESSLVCLVCSSLSNRLCKKQSVNRVQRGRWQVSPLICFPIGSPDLKLGRIWCPSLLWSSEVAQPDYCSGLSVVCPYRWCRSQSDLKCYCLLSSGLEYGHGSCQPHEMLQVCP